MAEHNNLQLTITRVDGPVFDGEAQSVTVPGADGELTVLARHEPFITLLKNGVITVRPHEGEEKTFTIESGTLEISKDQATILL